MKTFLLPDLGEGLTDSEIVAWKVAEGDTVELNQPLADIETAKAVVELPSPYEGVIAKLHAGEGETVDVGAPLIDFDLDDGSAVPASAPAAGDTVAAADDEAVTPDAPGPVGDEPDVVTAPASAPETNVAAQAEAAAPDDKPEKVSVLVGSITVHGGKPTRSKRTWDVEPFERAEKRGPNRAMPPVRKLAKDRGIDLQSVRPSGADGLVTRADVEGAGTASATSASGAAAAPASTREKVTGLRKHTAAAMAKSALTVPHAATFHQVDVTETLALAKSGDASFLALASRAILLAAKRWPDVASAFHADTNELERFAHVNLGIAVSTDRGLVVASVDQAETMDAVELTAQIKDRAVRAREGTLSMEELTSSNITISNVGVFGVDGGIPILNPGESAIIALGAIRKLPWNHQGEIVLRDVCTVTVSFDHRVLDGREAAGFLADIAAVLERPALALAR
ncbi:pyruvate dehydrogenase E2 component (dihydrolipoamide acetyltransferase) [Agrococcus baldri]|uniref:Dihydrolipoamide acetyltransferase component of pyruvate dehydrogenase complex n=1 Tax=Agrococcus baldri TaxID=153730 RepID=A0AA94L0Q0_9MICO|nr:dihydrolipoamide acetyltransferase family protein [Agrococcus baldri]SFS17961.1 pyruvate dehydrogenase E2 component (dihydrolipoamide acetyltransferase) [Agrococcus baldri]